LWEFQTYTLSCDGDTLDLDVSTLNICQGDTLALDAGLGFELTCRGMIDNDSFAARCDDVLDEGDCRTEIKATWSARRSDDFIEGEAKVFVNRNGSGCVSNGDDCFRLEQYGVRLATARCP
jgi:hypothetical protein